VAETGSTVTGRSVKAPSGNGVPFIRILLTGENDSRFRVTDSGGFYYMYHVPVGTYTVTFAWHGMQLFSTQLAVIEDEQVYTLGLPELPTGNEGLQGTITDMDGAVESARIWLVYPSGALAQAVSDENGFYEFKTLADSEGVVVVAEADDYVSQTVENVKIGFEGARQLDFELNPVVAPEVGKIAGMVKNKDGEVLVDAYVGAFPAGTEPSILAIATKEVLSGDSGYEIDKLPAGTYTLVCVRSGYAPESEIAVVEDGGEYTIDFLLMSEEDIWRSSDRVYGVHHEQDLTDSE
jgi:hypothetical protein